MPNYLDDKINEELNKSKMQEWINKLSYLPSYDKDAVKAWIGEVPFRVTKTPPDEFKKSYVLYDDEMLDNYIIKVATTKDGDTSYEDSDKLSGKISEIMKLSFSEPYSPEDDSVQFDDTQDNKNVEPPFIIGDKVECTKTGTKGTVLELPKEDGTVLVEFNLDGIDKKKEYVKCDQIIKQIIADPTPAQPDNVLCSEKDQKSDGKKANFGLLDSFRSKFRREQSADEIKPKEIGDDSPSLTKKAFYGLGSASNKLSTALSDKRAAIPALLLASLGSLGKTIEYASKAKVVQRGGEVVAEIGRHQLHNAEMQPWNIVRGLAESWRNAGVGRGNGNIFQKFGNVVKFVLANHRFLLAAAATAASLAALIVIIGRKMSDDPTYGENKEYATMIAKEYARLFPRKYNVAMDRRFSENENKDSKVEDNSSSNFDVNAVIMSGLLDKDPLTERFIRKITVTSPTIDLAQIIRKYYDPNMKLADAAKLAKETAPTVNFLDKEAQFNDFRIPDFYKPGFRYNI